MGKMSRNKGKVWEREVAACLRLIFGDQVRRGWQARDGGDDPDVVGLPHFWTEAKHHKVVNIGGAVRQVLKAQKVFKDDRWALIVSKSNRCDPLATMLWSSFLKLLTEWWELKNAQLQVVKKLVEAKPTRAELEARIAELERAAESDLPRNYDMGFADGLRGATKLVAALEPLAVEINDAADTDTRWEAVQAAISEARSQAVPAEKAVGGARTPPPLPGSPSRAR